MTPDDAFLMAIIESPDDDTPRLIYADYLEEHGQPERADFIRVQIELARLPQDDRRREELEAREQMLLDGHGEQWLAPLGGGDRVWMFQRGFVEEGTIEVESFLREADRLFRAAPLRRLRLQGKGALIARAVASPVLGRLTELSLHNNGLKVADFEALAASPHLAGLTSLSAGFTYAGPGAGRALAASPYLTRLRKLYLSESDLDDEDVAALAGSATMAEVRTLWLDGNSITPQGIAALADSSKLGRLTRLVLFDNLVGDEGAVRLASSAALSRLEDLELGNCGIGDHGALALARSDHLLRLRMLALWTSLEDSPLNNRISEAVARSLQERFGDRVHLWPTPDRLYRLHADSTGSTDSTDSTHLRPGPRIG